MFLELQNIPWSVRWFETRVVMLSSSRDSGGGDESNVGWAVSSKHTYHWLPRLPDQLYEGLLGGITRTTAGVHDYTLQIKTNESWNVSGSQFALVRFRLIVPSYVVPLCCVFSTIHPHISCARLFLFHNYIYLPLPKHDANIQPTVQLYYDKVAYAKAERLLCVK